MNNPNNENKEKIIKTYLGKRGYILLKKHFTKQFLDNVRRQLTVKPFVADDYGAPNEEFPVYTENTEKLYIPKYIGYELVGPPDENRVPEGNAINLKFNGKLRENQMEPVNACIKACRETGGGILALQCAAGKTVQAIYILSQLGGKTLIVVHKEFLLNQWIERIQQFLPDAKIGKIQQDKVDIAGKDIVIAMLQSISMKEYALDTFDSFRTVIIDECHRIGSEVFSRALRKINSKYMLGLSATPNRKDGLTKVFKWYIGDVIFSRKHVDTNIVKVERLIIKSNNEYYSQEINNFKGKPQMATMINNICENLHRTKVIVYKVKELLEEGRKILILSDRRAHLEDFHKLLVADGITSIGFYVGGMKQRDLDISAKKDVILSTYIMTSEGLDLPDLDTEILASPKSDIIQTVGRILRKKHDILAPKIIDVVDTFSLFEYQAIKRKKLYIARDYVIDDITVWDELGENGEPKIVNKVRYISRKKSSKSGDGCDGNGNGDDDLLSEAARNKKMETKIFHSGKSMFSSASTTTASTTSTTIKKEESIENKIANSKIEQDKIFKMFDK